jgi:hypothetical protein
MCNNVGFRGEVCFDAKQARNCFRNNFDAFEQGCQIFSGKNVPNEHKMYQMVIKYPKWPYNIIIYYISNLRPSKIYPNWDFWSENKPSGNPAFETRP